MKGAKMAALNGLEKSLEGVFVKSAPKLPENGKKMLVEWLPWINLVAGIFSLWAAYTLYHWSHLANGLINYANQISQAYGGTNVVTNRLGPAVWLGIAVLAVEGVLYLMAYPATKARTKRGWDLMFYALLLNIVYGVVVLFTSYGAGNFIGSLIGSAIGLYLLFQIRGKYLSGSAHSEA